MKPLNSCILCRISVGFLVNPCKINCFFHEHFFLFADRSKVFISLSVMVAKWEVKIKSYKKVLLRDRKRRTARGLASLALLSEGGGGERLSCLGEGTPVLSRGYPILSWLGHPSLAGPATGLWPGPVTGLGGPPSPERTWDQGSGNTTLLWTDKQNENITFL